MRTEHYLDEDYFERLLEEIAEGKASVGKILQIWYDRSQSKEKEELA